MLADLRRRVTRELQAARAEDGGFGPRPGLPSEPEPTALVAIALDDPPARAWLGDHQLSGGSFQIAGGDVVNDSFTPVAAIALSPGAARERALDHVVASWAPLWASYPPVPHDPNLHGWAWTRGAFGWVEPTSRALLALRLLRPTATEAIADAVGTLRDREVVGGGWNFGNRLAFGVELWAYGQTTAAALLALHGMDPTLEKRGLHALRELWVKETEGFLTAAMATAALRLHGDAAWKEAAAAAGASLDALVSEGDTVSLAWLSIAVGPGLDRLARRA